MKKYELSDFDFANAKDDHLFSKDGLYQLSKDKEGYIYPCHWYYQHPDWPKTKESGNFWSVMVHISYDYSFTFEGALQVLNMVLDSTWKHGEGRYLNGLPNES